MIQFGDVFQFNEKDYVYLHKIDETIYAAEILDNVISSRLINTYEKATYNGHEEYKKNMAFCFVELSTPEYEGRAAFLAKTGKDSLNDNCFFDIMGDLNKADLNQIQEEIIESDYIPSGLQNFVNKLPKQS